MLGSTTVGVRIGASLLAAALWTCAGEQEAAGPLVRVGDEDIDQIDLREYLARLPEPLRPSGEGTETARQLLQGLVDRQIMVLEAKRLGFDRDPEVAGRLHRQLTKWLLETVVNEQVGAGLAVTEKEIQEVYEEFHWNREVMPAHILSATEEDALEVIRLLEEGRSFDELARSRSIADDADRGGLVGGYFGPDDAATVLVACCQGLPVGEFTRTPVRTRDGYEVVQVLGERRIPLAAVRTRIAREVHYQKFYRERRDFLLELERKHGAVYHSQGIEALLAAARAGRPPTGPELQLPFVSFGEGRSISVGVAYRKLSRRSGFAVGLRDSVAVVSALRSLMTADSLFVLEARSRGLDQTPAYLAFQKEGYEKTFVAHLRAKEVLEKVHVPEAEMRREYDENLDNYTRASQHVDVTEIAAATQPEAAALLEQIRGGADMTALVRSHSVLTDARQTDGHMHLDDAARERWGEAVYRRLQEAKLGDLVGPVEVAEGYSVIRMETDQSPQYRSFDEVRHMVEHRLKLRRQHVAFESYIEELRTRYAYRVQWYDGRLAALADQGLW